MVPLLELLEREAVRRHRHAQFRAEPAPLHAVLPERERRQVFLWECYERLKLARLPGKLGVFLTQARCLSRYATSRAAASFAFRRTCFQLARGSREYAPERVPSHSSLSAHLHRHVLNHSYDRVYF